MNIAQRFAQSLSELGIERAYGLPGEDHMTLLDALEAAGIEYCTAFNESSAVIMAATDAKLTGRPGIAVLSMAPGVSNGMNGILHAYLEGLPVLVISGIQDSAKLPFVVRQGFDTQEMVRPATKWTTRIPAGADPGALICKAADIAMSDRPGPVYIELPDEVAMSDSPDGTGSQAVSLLRSEIDAAATGARSVRTPPANVMDDFVNQVRRAEHPALIIGGRKHTISATTLTAFANTLRVPTFTTSGQKGALDSRSPYYAGTLLNGNFEGKLLSVADLIITLDFEAYDVYNRPWAYGCPTVAVTSDPLTEWFQPFSQRVLADPEICLDTLTERIGSDGASRFTAQHVKEYKAGLRSALLDDSEEAGISVARAVETALELVDSNTIVCADAGFSKPLIALLSETAERHHFLASNALSTMGFSIPAGIAAARASGGQVMAFMGDGSLLMRATELPIAVNAPVPPVFVAIVDQALSQIGIKQARRKLRTVGVDLPKISCEKLGEGLGIRGADAGTPDEIRAALSTAWDPGAPPLLLGIHVDPSTSQRTFDLLRG